MCIYWDCFISLHQHLFFNFYCGIITASLVLRLKREVFLLRGAAHMLFSPHEIIIRDGVWKLASAVFMDEARTGQVNNAKPWGI